MFCSCNSQQHLRPGCIPTTLLHLGLMKRTEPGRQLSCTQTLKAAVLLASCLCFLPSARAVASHTTHITHPAAPTPAWPRLYCTSAGSNHRHQQQQQQGGRVCVPALVLALVALCCAKHTATSDEHASATPSQQGNTQCSRCYGWVRNQSAVLSPAPYVRIPHCAHTALPTGT